MRQFGEVELNSMLMWIGIPLVVVLIVLAVWPEKKKAPPAPPDPAPFDPLAEGWFVGRPELIGPDGVHPSDAGHAYLAEKIVPLIAGQLPKRT